MSNFNLIPEYLTKHIKTDKLSDTEFRLNEQLFVLQDNILRSKKIVSKAQAQTEQTFDFKWKKRDTFESHSSLNRMRQWLHDRYGDPLTFDWLKEVKQPILLDAGCGASMSALELWGGVLDKVHYIGIDVSGAVEVARARFIEKKIPAYFLQCDLLDIPLPEQSVDIIFSEGVLHHTDSTEDSLKGLAKLLKKNGRFLFYVYRRKSPIREFTDDFIREELQALSPEAAWELLMPLSKLGQALGELNIEIEVPESVTLLGIPAGKIDLQRLIYWHFFKAFYHKDLTLEELNHINYDWYAPKNARRHTVQEVRKWCSEANMVIEREIEEPAGITVIARKCG